MRHTHKHIPAGHELDWSWSRYRDQWASWGVTPEQAAIAQAPAEPAGWIPGPAYRPFDSEQGTCSHQRNPIDDRYRQTAARDIVTRYPGIAADQPQLAAELSAYDAYVGEYGDTSLESAGVKTFAS